MSARKSRFTKEGQSNRAQYGRRPVETRPTRPVMVIVCDDAKTAVRYFNEVARSLRGQLTLKVKRNPFDRAGPADVISSAIDELHSLQNVSTEGDTSTVWALIDLEQDAARQAQAWEAKKTGERNNVSVALSKPCYELWTLLHLVSTGAMFTNCAAVLAELERAWQEKFDQPLGPKAQVDYRKILGEMDTAASRAEEHRKRSDPSWTEVYLVVQAIRHRCP